MGPGGPVAKMPYSQYGGPGVNPWSGYYVSHITMKIEDPSQVDGPNIKRKFEFKESTNAHFFGCQNKSITTGHIASGKTLLHTPHWMGLEKGKSYPSLLQK